MKKLMFTAGAVAIAAGAFADMPAVYDYKATIKHMYLKEVNAKLPGGTRQVKVYQKYQKTATLKGYLIHDVLGATSAANVAGYGDPTAATIVADGGVAGGVGVTWQNKGPVNIGGAGTIADKVNNRAFLIVQNSSAEANVRRPKIMPAVLEAKFFDSKFKMDTAGNPIYSGGVAEGTLFVGGDLGVGVREYLRRDRADGPFANPSVAASRTGLARNAADQNGNVIRALGSYLDYGWTSIYLFGRYNGAQGSAFWSQYQRRAAAAAVLAGTAGATAATAITPANVNAQQIIPDGLGAASGRFYHDTWMNGVGLGKWGSADDSEQCCGFQTGGTTFALDTLAGKLKGGLFLCSENGYRADNYAKLGGLNWEDQFWNERAYDLRNTTNPANVANNVPAAGAIVFAPSYVVLGDIDQDDVWIDGDIELFTTDLLDGDWSIKRLTANVPSEPLTSTEIRELSQLNALNGSQYYVSTYSLWAADNSDLEDLNATIKGCARRLNSNVEFCRTTTTLRTIPLIATQGGNNGRYNVPFMDRNFARAYGLMGYAIHN